MCDCVYVCVCVCLCVSRYVYVCNRNIEVGKYKTSTTGGLKQYRDAYFTLKLMPNYQ